MTKDARRLLFAQAEADGDLARQVQLARPVARNLIIYDGIENDLLAVFDELAGARDGMYRDRLVMAAYSIGIAVGQLTDRDLFDGELPDAS